MRILTPVLLATFFLTLTGCNRKREFREFTPPDGSYTVLMPGKPTRGTNFENGLEITNYTVGWTGGAYEVGVAAIPAGRAFEPDEVVSSVARNMDARNTRTEGASANGEGWLDFEMEGGEPDVFAAGRVIVARGRAYLLLVVGGDAKLSNSDVQRFLKSFRLSSGTTPGPDTMPRAQVARPNPARPQAGWPQAPAAREPRETMVGHPNDPTFRDEAPAGAVLAGLDVWYDTFINYDVICAIRPIYRTGNRDSVGQFHGKETARGARVLARPGYAIGEINVMAGLGIDSMTVTFMRVNGERLDPNDSYASEKVGGPGGGGPTKFGGDGNPIVGIIGRKKENLNGFGIALAKR